jgi:uncharacterized coiled-coil DUF342 family protein
MSSLQSASPEVLAAIAAAVGAVIVKGFEKWIASRPTKETEEHKSEITALRQEIDKTHQLEVDALRDELDAARRAAAKWQKKYWEAYAISDSDEHKIVELTDTVRTLQTKIETLIANESLDKE